MNNIALIVSKMEGRVKHEILYIENWNIWLDIHIRKALIFFMGTKGTKRNQNYKGCREISI